MRLRRLPPPTKQAKDESEGENKADGDSGENAPAAGGRGARRASAIFNKVRLAQKATKRSSWMEVFQNANEF